MKLAIMQPYFFPYIGYFQLLSVVDKFVFYDDVNFIKGGWLNRNRLFLAGSIRYVTVPLSGASPFEKINRTQVAPGTAWAESMLSSIHQSYAKAPFYKQVCELLENVLRGNGRSLSSLASSSVIATADYLGLKKEFVLSSQIYGNEHKRGMERVLDICCTENASEYWNLPGGRDLYRAEDFAQKGIDLKFVDVSIRPYSQITSEFQPSLSILDVLMFNERATVLDMLSNHPAIA